MKISAIVVSRGDVDLTQIIERLSSAPSIDEILVWANGQHLTRYWPNSPSAFVRIERPVADLAVYGRYAAIEYAKHDLVFIQDDDCLVDAEAIIYASDHALSEFGGLVCNMPVSRWDDYPDSALVGWGSCFHRDLPEEAFASFWSAESAGLIRLPTHDISSFFNRECDAVFTTLTQHVKIDIGFQHLPWAEGPGRMFTEDPALHQRERQQMLELARKVRDGVQ